MNEHPLLEVSGLSKTFGGRRGQRRLAAVTDLSFDVPAGDSIAIVGESGSGKTTAARMIVGLEVPTAGEIRLDGEPVSANPARRERLRRARQAQIVFQNPYVSLDPRQTAEAAVSEVVGLHFGTDHAMRLVRARDLLASVGLGRREMAARPGQLSGGQNQRVAIAKALAAQPKLLVLDEAVSALDVSVQAQILNLLYDLRCDIGVSYVFITHNLDVVRQVCDRVLVMYRGMGVEIGAADEVLRSPRHPYTRRLVDSIPRPGVEWRVHAAVRDGSSPGCVFRDRCASAYAHCSDAPPLLEVASSHLSRCWLEVDGK